MKEKRFGSVGDSVDDATIGHKGHTMKSMDIN